MAGCYICRKCGLESWRNTAPSECPMCAALDKIAALERECADMLRLRTEDGEAFARLVDERDALRERLAAAELAVKCAEGVQAKITIAEPVVAAAVEVFESVGARDVTGEGSCYSWNSKVPGKVMERLLARVDAYRAARGEGG